VPATNFCEKCSSKFDPSEFFVLDNNLEEDNLHEYFQCNMCHCEPI